jgi:hypothetical protein
MTNLEFYSLMDRLFQDAKAIAKSKGEDYTRGSEDALANFKEGGKDIDIDPIKVCWIFMNKHYQAITNYVKTNGQSESEPISERIKDAINYLVLMQALITEKQQVYEKKVVSFGLDDKKNVLANLSDDGAVLATPETNF